MSEQPQSLIESKIWSQDSLNINLERWRFKDERIVFTNGVFDILHRGHVQLLDEAAKHGSKLIVAINSDASVKSLNKGPERPINKQADRAFVIAGLTSVSAVVIFDGHTPLDLLKLVRPNVLIKGGDYDAQETDPSSPKFIVGSIEQKSRQASTFVLPFIVGFSTTSIVEKIADGKS